MKRFDRRITVEVEVDYIASQLLESFKEDNPHKELLTEVIISTALEDERLGYLMQALNGYRQEINFIPGQSVYCSEKVYYNADRQEIGVCVVSDVNQYRKSKQVAVTWEWFKGETSKQETEWVSKESLTDISVKL